MVTKNDCICVNNQSQLEKSFSPSLQIRCSQLVILQSLFWAISCLFHDETNIAVCKSKNVAVTLKMSRLAQILAWCFVVLKAFPTFCDTEFAACRDGPWMFLLQPQQFFLESLNQISMLIVRIFLPQLALLYSSTDTHLPLYCVVTKDFYAGWVTPK